MQKIEMLRQVTGTRNGQDWPAPGGVLELPDDEAQQLIDNRIAVRSDKKVSHIFTEPVAAVVEPIQAATVTPPANAKIK